MDWLNTVRKIIDRKTMRLEFKIRTSFLFDSIASEPVKSGLLSKK